MSSGGQLNYDPPERHQRIKMRSADLIHVLIGLITNAAETIDPEQQPDGTVKISMTAADTTVRFTVTDNGIHTTDEPLPREGTLASMTRPALSLARCRRLVANAGSELKIETTSREATSVSFEIDKA